ncbi:hypothetical protein B0T20DRAFT_480557 [Sordaria brevicollis]|uniref:Uncharacterized protein n=1 Tax=Sordaria brevicollis TaxID=83679 RepID=A0AAE0UB05_SORBR|nr:hypothetical protein B0T20DRAFT_480557 [Sordaria brevicollis]
MDRTIADELVRYIQRNPALFLAMCDQIRLPDRFDKEKLKKPKSVRAARSHKQVPLFSTSLGFCQGHHLNMVVRGTGRFPMGNSSVNKYEGAMSNNQELILSHQQVAPSATSPVFHHGHNLSSSVGGRGADGFPLGYPSFQSEGSMSNARGVPSFTETGTKPSFAVDKCKEYASTDATHFKSNQQPPEDLSQNPSSSPSKPLRYINTQHSWEDLRDRMANRNIPKDGEDDDDGFGNPRTGQETFTEISQQMDDKDAIIADLKRQIALHEPEKSRSQTKREESLEVAMYCRSKRMVEEIVGHSLDPDALLQEEDFWIGNVPGDDSSVHERCRGGDA